MRLSVETNQTRNDEMQWRQPGLVIAENESVSQMGVQRVRQGTGVGEPDWNEESKANKQANLFPGQDMVSKTGTSKAAIQEEITGWCTARRRKRHDIAGHPRTPRDVQITRQLHNTGHQGPGADSLCSLGDAEHLRPS